MGGVRGAYAGPGALSRLAYCANPAPRPTLTIQPNAPPTPGPGSGSTPITSRDAASNPIGDSQRKFRGAPAAGASGTAKMLRLRQQEIGQKTKRAGWIPSYDFGW